MRSFTALACTIAVTACTGTDGDILRTRSDGSVTQRPRPAPAQHVADPAQRRAGHDGRRSQLHRRRRDTRVRDRGLHDAGRIVLCYFSAGTLEPFRDDASRFPASTLGAPLADYPDERWVDIRDATVRAIMQDRIIAAAGAGCDGVHPSGSPRSRRAPTSTSPAPIRSRTIAGSPPSAHGLGLSIGLVDATPRSAGSRRRFRLGRAVDLPRHRLRPASPFIGARKPVFLIEYGDETRAADVCPKARALGLSAIIKRDGNLDAFRVGCP